MSTFSECSKKKKHTNTKKIYVALKLKSCLKRINRKCGWEFVASSHPYGFPISASKLICTCVCLCEGIFSSMNFDEFEVSTHDTFYIFWLSFLIFHTFVNQRNTFYVSGIHFHLYIRDTQRKTTEIWSLIPLYICLNSIVKRPKCAVCLYGRFLRSHQEKSLHRIKKGRKQAQNKCKN